MILIGCFVCSVGQRLRLPPIGPGGEMVADALRAFPPYEARMKTSAYTPNCSVQAVR